MKRVFGFVALMFLLSSCDPAPAVVAPEPEPAAIQEGTRLADEVTEEDADWTDTPGEVVAEPEHAELTYTEEELEACFVAWEAEVEAVANGVLDDSTLRALAWECPSYDAWELGFLWYEYGGGPNTLKAICAFEEESPLCTDPKTVELIS